MSRCGALLFHPDGPTWAAAPPALLHWRGIPVRIIDQQAIDDAFRPVSLEEGQVHIVPSRWPAPKAFSRKSLATQQSLAKRTWCYVSCPD